MRDTTGSAAVVAGAIRGRAPVQGVKPDVRRWPQPEARSAALAEPLVLTPAESETVEQLAQRVTSDPLSDPDGFCAQARECGNALPPRIATRLHEFAWGVGGHGYLLVQGLPLPQEMPDTPADNVHCAAAGTLTARVQALFNERLGHMVGYEAEGQGRIFQDMVPTRSQIRAQTSLSSAVELELHTEQAFSPLRPDYVSLACLRGDAHALTYLYPARRLSAVLDPEQTAQLRLAQWTTSVDESFLADGRTFLLGLRRGPVPILGGAVDDPFVVFDQDLMRGISPAAEALKAMVVRRYLEQRDSHCLQPGELLLVDNHRVVHGRSDFTARFDGTDRFIVRSFVTTDPARSRHARPGNGRVVQSHFS